MKTRRHIVRAWLVRRVLFVLVKLSRFIQIGNPHGRAPKMKDEPDPEERIGEFEGGNVYCFADAIVTGHLGGLVLNSRNEVFSNLIQYHGHLKHLHPGIVNIKVPVAKGLAGTGIYLCTPEATGNYYHWMIDVTPRLWLLQQAGVKPEEVEFVFINGSGISWEIETLLVFGFRPDQIRICTKFNRFRVSRLFVPDRLTYLKYNRWKGEFLNRLFLKRPAKGRRRLFCGRKDASRRRLVNEDELFARLEPLGFLNVETQGMAIREQAELFSSASMIVGVHGAMLANSVFMADGCDAVEIQCRTAPREFYTNIYMEKGFKYHVVYAEAVGKALDDYDENLLDIVLTKSQIDAIVSHVDETLTIRLSELH